MKNVTISKARTFNEDSQIRIKGTVEVAERVVKFELETEEEFNPEMLVGVLVELLDGCSELITDIKYKDHEMVKDYGDTTSKGFTYFLMNG